MALVVDLEVLLDAEFLVANLALEVKVVGVNCLRERERERRLLSN
jgi:hypothetical protein